MGTREYNHRNGSNPFHEIATLYKRKVVGNKQRNKKKTENKNGKNCKKFYELLLYHWKTNIHHPVHVRIIFRCTKNEVFD